MFIILWYCNFLFLLYLLYHMYIKYYRIYKNNENFKKSVAKKMNEILRHRNFRRNFTIISLKVLKDLKINFAFIR